MCVGRRNYVLYYIFVTVANVVCIEGVHAFVMAMQNVAQSPGEQIENYAFRYF